jgi:hypothetical protein
MSVRQKIIDLLFFGHDPLKDFPAGKYQTDLQGWHSEHPYLTRAIVEKRPAIVVEVGVWKGASVVTMAREMKRLGLDAALIAIDTWLGSSENYNEKYIADLEFEEGYPRLFRKFAANICNEGLQDYVVPLPLDSVNAFHLLQARGIVPEVLHIDAGHDFRSVSTDLEAWWPQLAPGGVLVGDDYFTNWLGKPKWPGVRRAFDEFFAVNAHTAFENTDGKCFLRKPA